MIIRKQKNENYTTISNLALQDPGLSLKAKGLWAFVMAKPSNWNFNGRGLANELKESRPTINSILRELEKAGYLKRGMVHENDGKFAQGENVLYEEPWTKNTSTVNLSTNKILIHNNKTIEAEASIDPIFSSGEDNKNPAVAGRTETLQKLLYAVTAKYELPVMNHNHMRKWAKDLEQFDDSELYLETILDHDLRQEEGSFKPTLNRPFDILEKKKKIQRFYNGGEDYTSVDPRVSGSME